MDVMPLQSFHEADLPVYRAFWEAVARRDITGVAGLRQAMDDAINGVQSISDDAIRQAVNSYVNALWKLERGDLTNDSDAPDISNKADFVREVWDPFFASVIAGRGPSGQLVLFSEAVHA
jgi:hypothetical protein